MGLRWESKGEGCDKVGYLGKYKAFETYYDMFTSKHSSKSEVLVCYLNGIKKKLGSFEYQSESIARAEKVFDMWLEGAGLLENGGVE